MKKAFECIEEMHKKGILKDYAIGGATATMFYTEPFLTLDIDIFFNPPEKDKLILLTPFYDWLLKKKGLKTYKEYIMIGDTPIQFIPTLTELEKEALENATEIKYKNISLRCLTPEYLIPIFLKVSRDKDKIKIEKLLNETNINKKLLATVLKRYGLYKRFKKHYG